MRDPFAAALDAQFRAPGSAAAVYTGPDGRAVPIRVIRSQPTGEAVAGDFKIVVDTNLALLRRSEVAEPLGGDELAIGAMILAGEIVGGEPFTIAGVPTLDLEGMTWSCELLPA